MDTVLVRIAMVLYKLRRRLRHVLGIRKTVYVQERVPYFRELWRTAADGLGWEFQEIGWDFWEVRDANGLVTRIHNYIVELDDPVTLDLAGDKAATYRLLQAAGLTIPPYVTATLGSLERLTAFAAGHDGPFVVKPARNTSSGLGVTTDLATARQCLRAAGLALCYCDEILIEPYLPGESYRLLFLGHELVCASRRRGHRLEGDGTSSVADLLALETRRGASLAAYDAVLEARLLAGQGLDRASIPAKGISVLVRPTAAGSSDNEELRTVYDEDVTELICPELVEEARRASLAMNSEFCGVDLITPDPTRPLSESGGAINEINTTPGIHHHYNLKGEPAREPLAATVLRYLARKRAPVQQA